MAVTIDIPIDLRNPGMTTNPGNSFWTVSAKTGHDFGHWEYVLATDGDVFGMVAVPQNMAATPNAKIIVWVSHPGAITSDVTSMQVLTSYAETGEVIPSSPMTSVEINDFAIADAADTLESITFPATGSMTAPVAGDQMFVNVQHNGAKTEDTMDAQNTRVHAAYLRIDVV